MSALPMEAHRSHIEKITYPVACTTRWFLHILLVIFGKNASPLARLLDMLKMR